MRRRSLWLWASLTVATACGSSEPQAALLVLSDNDKYMLAAAEDQMVAECMWSNGFSDFPVLPNLLAPVYPLTDRRAYAAWEWDDVDLAHSIGYGIAASLEFDAIQWDAAEREKILDAWLESPAPVDRAAARSALWGDPAKQFLGELEGHQVSTPAEGCVAEARTDLYGSLDDFLLLTAYRMRVGDGGFWEVSSVRAYRRALGSWAVCMAAAGWRDLGSPLDAYDLIFRTYVGTSPENEKAVAAADALCNVETELRAAGSEALAKVRDDMAAELEDLSSQASEIADRALRRAGGAIASLVES